MRGLEEVLPIALCDGSVRMINQKVALDVWKLLSARNDGKPEEDPDAPALRTVQVHVHLAEATQPARGVPGHDPERERV